MKKLINTINKWLINVTEILKNVLVFAVVCGLLFNDPFGIIDTISNLISVVSSTLLFYSLKRINQYENLITEFQQIIEFATNKMKLVDSKGHYESDDETGFFFQQLKDLQTLLNDIFEVEEIKNENKK